MGFGTGSLSLSLVDCGLAGCLPMLYKQGSPVHSGQGQSSRACSASDPLQNGIVNKVNKSILCMESL